MGGHAQIMKTTKGGGAGHYALKKEENPSEIQNWELLKLVPNGLIMH